MAQANRALMARPSSHDGAMPQSSFGVIARSLLIGHIAFLTLVDLFATQAILPLLTRPYGVTPAAMGLAVNATTLGMAVASLAVAFFSQRIDRRRGIIISLALLAIPTFLLADAPNVAVFAGLRIAQGLCMVRPLRSLLPISASGAVLTIQPEHSRPTLPAMWRRTTSAGCYRRRSPIISAWPVTSLSSLASISPARSSSI